MLPARGTEVILVNSTASSAAEALPAPATPPPTPPAASVAEREVRLTTYLVVGVLLTGLVLQVWIPARRDDARRERVPREHGDSGSGSSSPAACAQTIAGFRFIATLSWCSRWMATSGRSSCS